MAIKGNADTERMSFKAAAVLKTTTSQYKACYISGSMTVSLATNASDRVVGIIDDMPTASSSMVTVIVHGLATGLMKSATAAVIGLYMCAGSQGSLVHALTNTTAGQRCVGLLLNEPGSGGACTIFVNPRSVGTIVV